MNPEHSVPSIIGATDRRQGFVAGTAAGLTGGIVVAASLPAPRRDLGGRSGRFIVAISQLTTRAQNLDGLRRA
jgi:hypothetical protein